MMDLDDLRERKRLLEKLGDDPAYRILLDALGQQVRARRIADFGHPIRSLDDSFAAAHGRGEIAGLQLAMALREHLIMDCEADIEQALVALEESTDGRVDE